MAGRPKRRARRAALAAQYADVPVTTQERRGGPPPTTWEEVLDEALLDDAIELNRRSRARPGSPPAVHERKAGRPSKLTPEVFSELIDGVRTGNFVSVAARAAGLSPETVKWWLRRGRGLDPDNPPVPPYTTLVAAIDQAHARAERTVVGNLVALSARDPRAAEKWLGVHARERWGEATEEPGVPGMNVAIDNRQVIVVSPEDLRTLASQQLALRREMHLITRGPNDAGDGATADAVEPYLRGLVDTAPESIGR